MKIIKLKDVFTLITILLGFSALLFSYEGTFVIASVVILLGIVFDLMDGFVARITKTANKFGAELDRIADLIVYSLAPGILLFFVYYPMSRLIAFIVGVIPLLAGSIRLAYFNVKRVEYPGFWFGLPRPFVAALIVAYLNSSLFEITNPNYFGIFFVAMLCLLNLTFIPYPGHHERKFRHSHRTILLAFLIFLIAAAVKGVFWDILLLYCLVYVISPLFISKEERKKIRAFLKSWKK